MQVGVCDVDLVVDGLSFECLPWTDRWLADS